MEGVLRKGVLRRGVLMYCFNSRFQLLIKEKKSLSNKCLLINLSKSAPYTYIHTNIIHIRLAPTRSKSWNPQTLIARRSSYNALLLSPILRLAGNNWWLVVTTAMLPSSRCCYSCYYAPELAHFIAIVSSATLLPR